MIELLFPALFAICAVLLFWFVYQIVSAVPEEDRTYADKPPSLIRRVWFLIEIVSHYVGQYLSVEYREKTIQRLRKAELDYAMSPQQWVSAKIVYALLIGAAVTLLGLWLGVHSLVWTALGVFSGYIYLEIWMRDRVKLMEIHVLKNLPNFLDMLTLAIESGCNLTVGLNVAVEKSPDSPLKRAFARVLREIRSGRSRIDSLRALEERIDMPPITSLITALVQAEKTGASLGTVLRAQSTQRTNERFSRAEKLAMEAPVKMLGPLIFCIFPCTFLVLGFPIGMKMMNAFN
ncbi:type II secretion system (T2SS), F family protein [Collimonas arenae]|uniref:Type II secretion system (T2SS), F family protein n=1 Tax=Collimonas arenae TaxID=279058 RepID=A0A127QLX6_9BURK|nr:type II secretion system F family protein [Collimonas arenae]AMP00712.1 type II secretion system (T2SS), F family protein [Collimonas arenae]AMP10602.1 type II secretion system (T2SS), F family protein [Collimonas arenae]